MKSYMSFLLAFGLALAASAQAPQAPTPQRNGLNLLRRPTSVGASRPSTSAGIPAPTPASTAQAQAPGASTEAGGRSIEFNGAPVDMVFTVYQDLIGKTVLKDPQTPAANITLQPQKGQELSVEDKIEAIETVLEMNGIHMEPYGEKFMRAIPRKDVRKDGIPLIMDPEAKLGESTRVVSLMIPFKNIAVEEAQKALEGFKSNSGILLVFERTNAILVTDTEQIINRMREIAKTIDIKSEVTEVVEYIQVKYASANDIKQVIDSIVQESMKEQEKNGKAPVNQSTQQASRPVIGGLLNRNRPQQSSEPANNPSLVMTVSDADRGMIRGKVVTIADERSNKLLIITNASNMKFFKDVIAALDIETTPDTVVKVYRLKYAEAEDVSDMINDLIGNSSSSKGSGKSNQNQNARNGTSGSVTRNTTTQSKKPANQRSGEVKAGELNKDNTTVLADKRINGLVVMTNKELVPTVEQIIESMDIKLSQVLIETCIIEVTLGDDLQTGIDWVNNTFSNGREFDSMAGGGGGTAATTATALRGEKMSYSDAYKEAKSVLGDSATSSELAALAEKLIQESTQKFSGSPAGAGVTYFLKSERFNLSAVIKASKSDTRAKYIASPVVMTVDNKEATIEATEARKFFNGYETSSSYSTYVRTPKYDAKDIGITIKTTPKINPNGTVMLNVEEEYSQLGSGQSILVDDGGYATIDTALKRKMSSDILLDNMQSVIIGGLTETYSSEKETGIPILKDIPVVGRWLFGSVTLSEARKELLIFMTPYVLNDSESAQAEAIRRKKTLSDPRPWEDHGWSASVLADSVSKKEQLRRIKDEWRKQDEERTNRMAIEQEKVKRAEMLKAMSAEERAKWLLLHKAELAKEQQAELESKMLDDASQEELKKLAEEVRARKLAESEKEIKKAESETEKK